MRDFAVTPKLLSTMAGQVGFERFRLTERYVVESVVCRGGTVMPQPLGRITRLEQFLDFCAEHDYEVEDCRPDPEEPAWVVDWTVKYAGA